MRRFSRKRRRIQGGSWPWPLSLIWESKPSPSADDKNIELTRIYPSSKSEYDEDKDFEVPKEVEERRKKEKEEFEEKKRTTMKTFYNKPSSAPKQKTEVLSDDDARGYIRNQLGITNDDEITTIVEKYKSGEDDLLYRMYITKHIFPRLTSHELSKEDLENIILSLNLEERDKFFLDVYNLTYDENATLRPDLKAAEDLVLGKVRTIIRDGKWEKTQEDKHRYNKNIGNKPKLLHKPSAEEIAERRKEKQAIFKQRTVKDRPAGGRKTKRRPRKKR
jgi:hypothetical protein